MIITLIGSRRFEPWFLLWREVLELAGHEINNDISQCDYLMLLNKFAYIGETGMTGLYDATKLNKTIIALESWEKENGINHMHFQEAQDAAKKYNVCGKISPIDTYKFKDPYSVDILGPAGDLRNKCIKIVKEKEALILGYNNEQRTN